MADGLLNKASIILTPTGYKAGTLYNVAPVVEPYEDFDFARASVASRVNSSGLVEMVGRTLGSELVQNGDFSQLGSELVTNGDFATDSNWSKGGGATISGGTGNIIGDGSSFTSLTQANVFTVGKSYKITVDVTINSGLGLKFQDGSTNENFGFATTSGSYTFYGTANNSSFVIGRRTGGTAFNSTVDNVSVKQVDPNDYWTLGTGWSIENGIANVDTSSDNRIEQDGIVSDGNTYAITFTILNYNSGSIRLRLGNTYGEYTSGNGTYTQYIQCTTNDKFRIYASSSGADLSLDNVSVKEIIDTNNIPRISYDSNGENGHILLEPTSTNLITYSEDFNQWILNNATITSTLQTAPDGSAYVDKYVGSTISQDLRNTSASVAGTFTYSVFVKYINAPYIRLRAESKSTWFNVQNGTIGTNNFDDASIQSFGNGWYRISVTNTTSATTFNDFYIHPHSINNTTVEQDGGSFYVWGAQVEALSYATSYIPTLTGSTETRATETATGAGSAELINSTEGVLYAEIAALADDDTIYRSIFINDGTNNNRVGIRFSNTTNQIQALSYKNASLQGFGDYTLSNSEHFNKIAFKYKVNDFALWINGVEVATDTSGDVYTVGTLNNIDFYANGGQDFYGKVKALAVFNEALSDDELNNLTG